MNKKLIVIAGNLAVGKTTLADKIGDYLNWYIAHESVHDNPYLTDFYKDMNSWAYHLQVYFLGHRSNQHMKAYNHFKNAIVDRSIYEDGQIFAPALFHSGKISQRDYDSYMALFDFITRTIPTPHLLLYVKSSMESILSRIKSRGQDFDKNLTREYLEMINLYYTKWINNFSLCPILIVDSDKYNYLENNTDLLIIIQQIKSALIQ
jgi:deoxyadenosine/deoxycytidine kinase